MRKALAAVLVLLLLLCGVTVYAFCAVMGPKEKVSYEESVFYGDRSAADGVTISLKTNYNHNLFWDSDIRFSNGDYSCETEYAFSASTLDEEAQTGNLGVFLWTSHEIISDGFTDTIEKHLEGMKPGEEDEFELRLADFYDYYPITGRINLPESFQWFSPEIAAEDTVVGDVGQYNGKKLSEFFRIPVFEGEYYTVSVKKDRESAGSYQSYTSGHGVSAASDCFEFRTSGVCTEDACYFWFPNRTNYGIKIDTGMIPGGYGIYILPYGYVDEENYHGLDSYEGIDVNVDELRVFYPIDENVCIKALGKSGDNKELILHTVEDGKYYVNIIDART
ncbi:MAG: hypothetical protein HUJ65_06870, partial [Oscillospiraceae bacterium]|nr:hypothetical protein [Oscillospiraceae bacterium]